MDFGGFYNMRDLGGYETQGGLITRWNKYIRSDAEGNLSAGEQEYLYGLGVRAVVDLRYPGEIRRKESPFKGYKDIKYYSVNMLENYTFAGINDMGDAYIAWTETARDKILRVFRIFLDHLESGVIFHCSIGKDRTGITAALLLGLAGCSPADIVADYAESFANNSRRASYLDVPPDEKFYMYSEPEYMERFLAHLDSRYGGPAEYLVSIGLEPGEVEALKESFVR